MKKTGAHPAVSYTGSGVLNSIITVGTATYTMQDLTVAYGNQGSRMAVNSELPSLDKPSVLQLFPNPVNHGQLNVMAQKNGKGGIGEIVMTDLQGKEVSRHSVNFDNTVSVPTRGLKAGLYLVQIRSEHFATTEKVMVE